MSTEPNTPYGPPAHPGQHPTFPPQLPPAPPTRRSGSALLLITVGITIGLFLGIGGTLLAGSLNFSGSPFAAALESCGLEDDMTSRIGDDGGSLDLDHKGMEDVRGISHDDLDCVLDELEAPDSVISQMEQTRALDGRQSEEWNGIEASWGYHPDSGLDVLLALQ